VDGSGNAYVTGGTLTGFPITANAIETSLSKGALAAFVTTLNATGSGLLFSTYLGGTTRGDNSEGAGIAVDNSGNIYVTGRTAGDFPTTSGALQTTYAGGDFDAFVARISPVVSAASAPAAASAVNSLNLASIGGSIGPLPAAAAGGATQGAVLDRALAPSRAVVPLPVGADADQRRPVLPLSRQPWLDHLFAGFDGRPLQELFLGGKSRGALGIRQPALRSASYEGPAE
jgi:hypothetical protein